MQQKKLSLLSAILMNMNIMVGGGIFAGPSIMAATAGNASFLLWIIVALLFFPAVWSTAQIGLMLPGGGNFYSYARGGLGERAGFFSGWIYIIGYAFAAAVELIFLRNAFVAALGDHWIFNNHILFKTLVMLAVLAINVVSVQIIGAFQNFLTIAKLTPLLILIAIFPFYLNPSFTITAHEISMLPYVLTFAIFGFLGFESCTNVSHLIEDSDRNAPRALLIGFGATALIYTLFHLGVLQVMGLKNLVLYTASSFARFIHAPIPGFTNALDMLISAAAVFTFLGGTIGMVFGTSSLWHAMAQKGLFSNAAVLNKTNQFGRPWVCILVQSAIVLSLSTLINDAQILGSLCNMGAFIAFMFIFASLFVLQVRQNRRFALLTTMVALAFCMGLISYSFMSMAPTMYGCFIGLLPMIALVAAGLFIYQRTDETTPTVTSWESTSK